MKHMHIFLKVTFFFYRFFPLYYSYTSNKKKNHFNDKKNEYHFRKVCL